MLPQVSERLQMISPTISPSNSHYANKLVSDDMAEKIRLILVGKREDLTTRPAEGPESKDERTLRDWVIR